jgi:Glycosyl hydrolase family 65 central catalytic domain
MTAIYTSERRARGWLARVGHPPGPCRRGVGGPPSAPTSASGVVRLPGNGYQGAFYPWTAGDDGYTGADCYGTTTDSNDKIISDPNFSCSQELHLHADIAMAQWEYYEATGDTTWLRRLQRRAD